MTTTGEPGTIRTRIPARLDRLPWSGFHWRVVIGLGTVWILDGLEVTIVGSIAPRLPSRAAASTWTQRTSARPRHLCRRRVRRGAVLRPAHRPLRPQEAVHAYARRSTCWRRWRPRFVRTVVVLPVPLPHRNRHRRRVRGDQLGHRRADPGPQPRPRRSVINGSYWLGAAIGGLRPRAAHTTIFAGRRRLAAGLRDRRVLGLGILLVRRNVPESPRWLFIHGHDEEAERIVDGIERRCEAETGEPLPEPARAITVRQRKSIVFREIARVTVSGATPAAPSSGLSLFIGQAFMYNAVTFDLGTILITSSTSRPARCPTSGGLRARELPRPAAARTALRHRRPEAHDRRHLPRLRGAHRGDRGLLSTRTC